MSNIAARLINWQKQHGRHHLPWQGTHDPYAIWLSEIMLQQTQVGTVIPYYQRFLRHFPDISSLSQAPLDDILSLWSGLGYYSRARHLHQAACIIVRDYHGTFPKKRELIQQLPGIGRSTAAAIMVFAYGHRSAILDGNVKRVFSRYFGIDGYPGKKKVQDQLWLKAEESLPNGNSRKCHQVYTQALMDLGATICTRHKPQCHDCPLRSDCVALKEKRTDQLPTTKPRVSLPKKEAIFLILLQQKKILLEKRPDTGIWGGLWCLPEIHIEEDIGAYCTQHFKTEVKPLFNFPPLNHTFTHFKLRIHPRLLRITSQIDTRQEGKIWIEPDEALDKAIPTPVRKLIKQYVHSDNSINNTESV